MTNLLPGFNALLLRRYPLLPPGVIYTKQNQILKLCKREKAKNTNLGLMQRMALEIITKYSNQ